VRIGHHPEEATVIAYAAGTLDEPLAVAVASHLAWCGACRRVVRVGEAIGGALLDSMEETPLRDDALARAMGRLDAAVAAGVRTEPGGVDSDGLGLPYPLASRLGVPLDHLRWRRRGRGIAVHALPLSANAPGRLLLVRGVAGTRMPAHGHEGAEITVVLRGAYRDAFGRFAMGDVAELGEDAEHAPVVEPGEDCICLVATEGRLRFGNPLLRLLRPILGV